MLLKVGADVQGVAVADWSSAASFTPAPLAGEERKMGDRTHWNEDLMRHPAQAEVVQELLDGLRNRNRRQILKLAIEAGGPLSPSRASEKLPASLSTIGKHFRVLADIGLIALADEVPNRGGVEHLYLPVDELINHPIVQAVLMCM